MGENTLDMDCIKKRGWSALWPVSPDLAGDGMINSDVAIKKARQAVVDHNYEAYNCIRALQPLVFRILESAP